MVFLGCALFGELFHQLSREVFPAHGLSLEHLEHLEMREATRPRPECSRGVVIFALLPKQPRHLLHHVLGLMPVRQQRHYIAQQIEVTPGIQGGEVLVRELFWHRLYQASIHYPPMRQKSF